MSQQPILDASVLNLFNIDIDKELCSICLEELEDEKTIYKIDSCNHLFHTKCILEMYIQSNSRSCPMCRQIISATSSSSSSLYNNKFKLSLIKKYVKKVDANPSIVSFYNEFISYNKKISEFKKKLIATQKLLTTLYKENKPIFKEKEKLEKNLIEIKIFLKRNELCFATKYRYRRFAYRQNLSFIKDIVNDVKKDVNDRINKKVKIVEDELKKIEENNVFVEYKNLEKKIKRINNQKIKFEHEQLVLKNTILSIPIRSL